MSAPLRTLVVEDDPAIARITAAFASAHPGIEVVATIGTVAEALTHLAAIAPDLVLLDVHLPDGNGLDLLREIRATGDRRTEVVLLTAASDLASVRRARAGGVRHYLVKPFRSEDLRQRLDLVVADWAAAPGTDGPLSQDAVDRLLGPGSAAMPVLPKGLSPGTLELVRAAVDAQERTAIDIAAIAGLSRVSARRYLDHLVRVGEVHQSARFGTSGRPVHLYARTGPAATA